MKRKRERKNNLEKERKKRSRCRYEGGLGGQTRRLNIGVGLRWAVKYIVGIENLHPSPSYEKTGSVSETGFAKVKLLRLKI